MEFIEIDGMQHMKVYDTTTTPNIKHSWVPAGETIIPPLTPVTPPSGNVIITGFDFGNNEWLFTETVPVGNYETLSKLVSSFMLELAKTKKEVAAVTASNAAIVADHEELKKEKAAIKTRLTKAENRLTKLEGTNTELPIEETETPAEDEATTEEPSQEGPAETETPAEGGEADVSE